MLENWLNSNSKNKFPTKKTSPNFLDKIYKFGQQKKHVTKTHKPLVVCHQSLVVGHCAVIENASNWKKVCGDWN